MRLGLFGPGLVGQRLLPPSYPDFALVKDEDGDWAIEDDGQTEPDGYFVIDTDGDLAIDDTVTSGLTIVRDDDGDFAVEIP